MCDCNQGFELDVDLLGDILSKMAKNGMKITKSTFWEENSGGHGGDKPIFWVVWGIPLVLPH